MKRFNKKNSIRQYLKKDKAFKIASDLSMMVIKED